MANPFSCKLPITMHRSPYRTIDPSRPELSQHGRAALITGSSSGIGFAIARNFARAKAAVVILTGRQAESLADAVKQLELQYPSTRFIGKQMDIANSAHVDKLWDELHAEGLVVDVLVLNAARVQRTGPTMLELGPEEVFEDFITNVKGSMHFATRFYKQPLRQKDRKLVWT
jgi:NAD(P)-dependent dehydrogenase (short-subunit alcohol dehydrogenase family)